VVHGLSIGRNQLTLPGIITNRTSFAGHEPILGTATPESVPFVGALPRDEGLHVPDRHLGLVQAGEVDDLDSRLEAAGITDLPEPVVFESSPAAEPAPRLAGVRIAIAHDAAFASLDPGNRARLATMGVETIFVSPGAGTACPPPMPSGSPTATCNARPAP
jgi:cobyrinic acid a,c-diamide synthase